MDKKNELTASAGERQNGQYTPNRCIAFVLITLVLLLPFLGKRIGYPAQTIENHSLKNIYRALTEPFIKQTEHLPAAALIPVLRRSFLHIAGLEKRSEWDSFFYRFDETGQFGMSDAEFSFDGLSNAAIGLDEDGGLPLELQRGFSPQLLRNVAAPIPYSSRRPLRLFFFGDSQMHSLAAGMTRALGSDKAVSVQELSVHSSGFLRSDYYNWPQKLEALFGSQKEEDYFDAAVLIMGMNDYQNVWTEQDGLYAAGTPEWEELYRKKVKLHLDIVLKFVPRLYWLGLPTVRKAEYNEKVEYMDRIHCSIAEEYETQQLVKISLKNFVSEYGAAYVNFVQEEKRRLPFMQSDGIHYTIEGGEYLMKKFLARLRHDYTFTAQEQSDKSGNAG